MSFLAQPGTLVTAPGAANTNSDNIWVRDVDYVVIDGFESTAAPRAGIAVQGEPDANATGVVIRNCFCHDNGRWGIFTGRRPNSRERRPKSMSSPPDPENEFSS